MVSIEPSGFFFRFALRRTQKMQPPSCASCPPRGTGRIEMPRHYLNRGHTQVQVIRHIATGGCPGGGGGGLPDPPRAAMKILFQVYRTFGGCYTITFFNNNTVDAE